MTLQGYLHRSGYRTAFFGKYLNSWRLADDPPYFDRWAVFPQSTRATYSGGEWNVDGKVKSVAEYSTDFLTSRALDFLREAEGQEDSRPWLMYVSTPAAHPPFRIQPKFRSAEVDRWTPNPAMFEEDLSDKPPHVQTPLTRGCDEGCARRTREKQLRTLLSVDALVKRTSDALAAMGEDNTLAIYVSDNGTLWGEHGLGRKSQPYLSSVHVPLKLRWPDRSAPVVDDRLTATVDIAPTVLAAAELRPRPSVPMDGHDLLSEDWRRSAILLEYWPVGNLPAFASLLSKRFQYTEYYESNNTVGFREYYDLKRDRWQLHNLLADRDPSIGSRRRVSLHSRLQAHRRCSGRSCP